jgi:FkbM family methyltransferase
MIKVGSLFFPDGETHFTYLRNEILHYGERDRCAAYRYVRRWRRAIDVGANVGIFSCDFAHRFDEVIAFEPIPATRECLAANVPDNVHIEPYAVTDVASLLQMYQTPSSGASFVCSHEQVVTPFDELDDTKVIDVPGRPLDSFDFDAVDLIKLDIQGAEYPALLGARETILRHRPVVMVEEKAASIEKVGAEVNAAQLESIRKTAELLRCYGMTPQEKAQTDRVYVFED